MKNKVFLNKVYEKYNNIDEVYKDDDFLKTNFIKENRKSIKNKYIMLILVMVMAISGSIYGAIKIVQKVQIVPNTDEVNVINENDIWIGSFKLAWDELEKFIGREIVFEQESQLANSLNSNKFNKNEISSDDYYLKVGYSTKKLGKEIMNEVKDKYDQIPSIDLNNYNSYTKGITVYSIINKEFTFKYKFDTLLGATFGNSISKYKYFGIDTKSDAKLKDMISVLFYNDNNDYAIQIDTNEGEKLVLYRTDINSSFDEAYSRVNKESKEYTGSRKLNKYDEVKIPFLSLSGMVKYNELLGKTIVGTKGLYIKEAIQQVEFNLNESGGNLKSEAGIATVYLSANIDGKKYYFNDNFILFMIEQDKEIPYMCLNVENTDILVEE